jgi:FAD-linked sulfhydryl oxidase
MVELESGGWNWSKGIPKQIWGNRGWNWLHNLAISYPKNPTKKTEFDTFFRIWNFVGKIPCIECRSHAKDYIIRNIPDLSSTYALQSWVWKFHNNVNTRLGKRTLSFNEYKNLYSEEIAAAEIAATRRY